MRGATDAGPSVQIIFAFLSDIAKHLSCYGFLLFVTKSAASVLTLRQAYSGYH
jgi:hypothetical protein